LRRRKDKAFLSAESPLEFMDIFGKQWSKPALQVLGDLTPAIEELAKTMLNRSWLE